MQADSCLPRILVLVGELVVAGSNMRVLLVYRVHLRCWMLVNEVCLLASEVVCAVFVVFAGCSLLDCDQGHQRRLRDRECGDILEMAHLVHEELV